MLFERLEILWGVASHRLDHLLAQLHRRRQRLRIASQNESEIHVEQFPARREQQIVVVTIADAQDVRDDAVAVRMGEGEKRGWKSTDQKQCRALEIKWIKFASSTYFFIHFFHDFDQRFLAAS